MKRLAPKVCSQAEGSSLGVTEVAMRAAVRCAAALAIGFGVGFPHPAAAAPGPARQMIPSDGWGGARCRFDDLPELTLRHSRTSRNAGILLTSLTQDGKDRKSEFTASFHPSEHGINGIYTDNPMFSLRAASHAQREVVSAIILADGREFGRTSGAGATFKLKNYFGIHASGGGDAVQVSPIFIGYPFDTNLRGAKEVAVHLYDRQGSEVSRWRFAMAPLHRVRPLLSASNWNCLGAKPPPRPKEDAVTAR